MKPPRPTHARRETGQARRGLALALGVALAAAACATPPPPVVIEMTNQLRFMPGQVHVKAGTLVKWHNVSLLVHTVTADPQKAARSEDVTLPAGAAPFDSGNLAPEGVFSHVFTVPGTYRYFCIPHEGAGMTGSVVVEPG